MKWKLTPNVFVGICVSHFFCFLSVYYVLFVFVLCLVPNVECVSRLSIHDCSIDFPWRLFIYTTLWPIEQGPSWSWSYCSWIYNYLCNQCLSPLTLWARILLMTRCTRYNSIWSSLSVTCDRWVVSMGAPMPSTQKIARHDIA
jgi:hypothetical protein